MTTLRPRHLAPLFLVGGALLLTRPDPATADDVLVGTVTVVDGDTLELHGTRVRLHGIDAPESGQACTDASGRAYPCGGRAANALDALIGRKPVRCRRTDTDRYGRTVAVCEAGGVDLNGALVAAGWALAYRAYSTDYVGEEQAAAAAKRGMWAGTFDAPWDYRRARRGGATTQAKATPVERRPGCCKTCRAGKPCGDTCIPADRACHAAPGCACAAE